MRRTALVLMMGVFVLAVAGRPGSARAQGTAEQPSLLVLHVDSDVLSDGDKEKVLKAQKETLAKYKKYTLVATQKIDLLDEMVNFECLEMDADCIAKICAGKGADLVLYTAFDGSKFSSKLVKIADASLVKDHSVAATKKKVAKVAGKDGVIGVFGALPIKKKLVEVSLDANVEAAEVFVNQKRVGTTPVKLKLKPGAYTVSVRKKEFLMVEEALNIAAPGPVKWKATMKPVPKKVVIKPVKPIKPIKHKDDKKDDGSTPFYQTWWFWTGVGVVAAGIIGGTAYAVNAGSSDFEVGTVKFSINSTAAEKDYIYYR
jgi:hypothetical protein